LVLAGQGGRGALRVTISAPCCVTSLLERASPSMQDVVQTVIPDVVR
jgi:hypothetical protein